MPHTEHRLPAEWERQSATLLAWPHEKSDWADNNLAAVQEEYAELIRAITRRQKAVVLVPPGNSEVRKRLGDRPGLHLIEVRYNDTWCRDYGPITMVHSGERLVLDFYFNGWGGKYPSSFDNRVNTLLARQDIFNRFTFRQYLFELEGGAIDSDGKGRLLVNWHCLHARHPHLTRREIDHELHTLLNLDKIIGIDIEPTAGDDTDGHIDTLARFHFTGCDRLPGAGRR
ncbi:MAG: agmatine deiminase family protein [Wenzhouxiangella sp.]